MAPPDDDPGGVGARRLRRKKVSRFDHQSNSNLTCLHKMSSSSLVVKAQGELPTQHQVQTRRFGSARPSPVTMNTLKSYASSKGAASLEPDDLDGVALNLLEVDSSPMQLGEWGDATVPHPPLLAGRQIRICRAVSGIGHDGIVAIVLGSICGSEEHVAAKARDLVMKASEGRMPSSKMLDELRVSKNAQGSCAVIIKTEANNGEDFQVPTCMPARTRSRGFIGPLPQVALRLLGLLQTSAAHMDCLGQDGSKSIARPTVHIETNHTGQPINIIFKASRLPPELARESLAGVPRRPAEPLSRPHWVLPPLRVRSTPRSSPSTP